MMEMCTDNRFELIEKYRRKLIESTNIESSLEEMAVLDDIMFRCWQMGWLDSLEKQPIISQWIPVSERLPNDGEIVLVSVLTYGENKGAFVDTLKMSNGKWYVFEPFCGWEEVTCDIIAWMPKPEPYKEDKN